MKTLSLITRSAAETKKIGRTLGRYLKSGDVVALEGALGSGKTTLVKGIAKGLGVASEKQVSSPTYVLIHEYQGREKIYHLDWYRLEKVTGLDEELALECIGSGAVTLVEWPARGRRLLPADTLHAAISHGGPTRRRLKFSCSKGLRFEMSRALKRS